MEQDNPNQISINKLDYEDSLCELDYFHDKLIDQQDYSNIQQSLSSDSNDYYTNVEQSINQFQSMSISYQNQDKRLNKNSHKSFDLMSKLGSDLDNVSGWEGTQQDFYNPKSQMNKNVKSKFVNYSKHPNQAQNGNGSLQMNQEQLRQASQGTLRQSLTHNVQSNQFPYSNGLPSRTNNDQYFYNEQLEGVNTQQSQRVRQNKRVVSHNKYHHLSIDGNLKQIKIDKLNLRNTKCYDYQGDTSIADSRNHSQQSTSQNKDIL
eukprot:403370768